MVWVGVETETRGSEVADEEEASAEGQGWREAQEAAQEGVTSGWSELSRCLAPITDDTPETLRDNSNVRSLR